MNVGEIKAIETYNTWVNEVKQTVPKHRLLVFDVKEGWHPLCQFLDLPVPESPFPNINDSESMIQNIRKLRKVAFFMIYVLPGLIVVTFIVWFQMISLF